MSTISASTTTTTAYKVTADTTGTLVLQTGSTPTTAVTIGSDQSVTFAGAVSLSGNQTTTGNLTVNGNTTLGDASTDTILMTGAPSIGGAGLGMGMGFRNRIINGAMVIDQRNAGASVTNISGSVYPVDRFYALGSQASKFTIQQNAGSVTPPTGFINYLGVTSSSAYSVLAGDYFTITQNIEGLNTADLGWGTASASTVTLSFWVRSSLTGTFGGNFRNSAGDRNYPFTYTISSANTWEQKSVTVAGDTTGTWLKTNGLGVGVIFGLGIGSTFSGTAGAWTSSNVLGATGATSVVGTNGATFYITGVQLEKGSTATSFDYRPYGTELMLCQRYFQKSFPVSVAPYNNTTATTIASGNFAEVGGSGTTSGTSYKKGRAVLNPEMRTTPSTITLYQPNGSAATASNFGDIANGSNTTTYAASISISCSTYFDVSPNNGNGITNVANPFGVNWTASAEL